MNGLEEIREYAIKFICEKEYIQQEIAEIEKQRDELAQKRNETKKVTSTENSVIEEIGQQISKLGNESQELQNKLDSKIHAEKAKINLVIDNLIAQGIRKIRKINEEIQELDEKNEKQKERQARYEVQKQEFYARFGRMPELSQSALIASKHQEEQVIEDENELRKFEEQIKKAQEEISDLAIVRQELKNGNWNYILDCTNKEIRMEEISVNELQPIDELYVEEFNPKEELYVEEFKAVEEIVDPLEQLARSIVEEIAAEQAKSPVEEEIIAFEKESEKEKKERVIIPLFGQRATISTITIKIEEGELVYKAQMSDGEEIAIIPSKIGDGNVLLRDKQSREECSEILANYSITEFKPFDKNVVAKIDPLVCELLVECADTYGYDAQELIYNYAMSFSKTEEVDMEKVPGLIYNLYHIENSLLTKKEKSIMKRICKNASKNEKVEIIESFTVFKKIKYVLKRIFAVNNIKVLPEAKY